MPSLASLGGNMQKAETEVTLTWQLGYLVRRSCNGRQGFCLGAPPPIREHLKVRGCFNPT